MSISLRLTEAESELFKAYAELHGITVSELVRQSVMERIEDELDLKAYNEALAEHRANPTTYSQSEVERMLAEDDK